MILRELLKLLKGIQQCHPEAADADVWAIGKQGEKHPVSYVGYDKRHKPARIKLEQ